MYLELLAPQSNLTVNVKLIKILGRDTAIYVSALLEQYYQNVIGNGDLSGSYDIDRVQITERTSLTVEEQYKIDAILQNLEVITFDSGNHDHMAIDAKALVSMISESDAAAIEEYRKKAKVKSVRQSKNFYIIKRLKDGIVETDVDIKLAMCNWLDTLAELDQAISKQQLQIWIDTVNNYTSDKQVKIGIYKQAAMLNMHDVHKAIQKYEISQRNSTKNGSFIGTPQKIGTTVDTSKKF